MSVTLGELFERQTCKKASQGSVWRFRLTALIFAHSWPVVGLNLELKLGNANAAYLRFGLRVDEIRRP